MEECERWILIEKKNAVKMKYIWQQDYLGWVANLLDKKRELSSPGFHKTVTSSLQTRKGIRSLAFVYSSLFHSPRLNECHYLWQITPC